MRQKIYSLESEISGKSSRKRKSSNFISDIEVNNSTDDQIVEDLDTNEDMIILKNANHETQKDLIKTKLTSSLQLRIAAFKNQKIQQLSRCFPFFY